MRGTRFVNSLGYGVMVTLQILVLSFLVRVRVPQQKIRNLYGSGFFVVYSLFFVLSIDSFDLLLDKFYLVF